MRHSTTGVAESRTPKSPAKVLAATIATALVAGGIAFSAAAPAHAAVTDTITGYSLDWGFQVGANSWRIDATGATLKSPVSVAASEGQPVAYTT